MSMDSPSGKFLLPFGFVCFLIYTYYNTSDKTVPQKPEKRRISHKVTLVTAYFPLPNTKSKHSEKQYQKWMKNFFSVVETPLIIFTTNSALPLLKEMRDDKTTEYILYPDHWSIPFIRENGLKEIYEMQHEIDPEKKLHSPDLYAIWNSKPWMVKKAAEYNPFNSSFFYWMDAGSIRTKRTNLSKFPNEEKIQRTFSDKLNSNKVHLFAISPFPEERSYKSILHSDIIIGGFFGGSAKAVKWFSQGFKRQHDKLLMSGEFIGKEQPLFSWLALQQPHRFIVTCSCMEKWRLFCGDPWFYFQQWYGGKGNGICGEAKAIGMETFITF